MGAILLIVHEKIHRPYHLISLPIVFRGKIILTFVMFCHSDKKRSLNLELVLFLHLGKDKRNIYDINVHTRYNVMYKLILKLSQ